MHAQTHNEVNPRSGHCVLCIDQAFRSFGSKRVDSLGKRIMKLPLFMADLFSDLAVLSDDAELIEWRVLIAASLRQLSTLLGFEDLVPNTHPGFGRRAFNVNLS
jgi:hypothetical protein